MAKVKSFRAEYGLTIELRGEYHKFYCGIEVEPDESESVEQVKEKAWNTVYVEIEKQVREL